MKAIVVVLIECFVDADPLKELVEIQSILRLYLLSLFYVYFCFPKDALGKLFYKLLDIDSFNIQKLISVFESNDCVLNFPHIFEILNHLFANHAWKLLF